MVAVPGGKESLDGLFNHACGHFDYARATAVFHLDEAPFPQYVDGFADGGTIHVQRSYEFSFCRQQFTRLEVARGYHLLNVISYLLVQSVSD
jgi:hypothetical protein